MKWRLNAWEECAECGGSVAYQPVTGYDPETEDGDNDGWTEDGEPQAWRDDLAQDNDPVVCLDPECRAQGWWLCSEDGAVARFPDEIDAMDSAEHRGMLEGM